MSTTEVAEVRTVERTPEAGELRDALAVFMWVHPGADQPPEAVTLIESVRALSCSAHGWCGRI